MGVEINKQGTEAKHLVSPVITALRTEHKRRLASGKIRNGNPPRDIHTLRKEIENAMATNNLDAVKTMIGRWSWNDNEVQRLLEDKERIIREKAKKTLEGRTKFLKHVRKILQFEESSKWTEVGPDHPIRKSELQALLQRSMPERSVVYTRKNKRKDDLYLAYFSNRPELSVLYRVRFRGWVGWGNMEDFKTGLRGKIWNRIQDQKKGVGEFVLAERKDVECKLNNEEHRGDLIYDFAAAAIGAMEAG